MTAITLRNTPDTRTSALGCMHPSGLDATFATELIATTMPGPVTANTYTQGLMAMPTTIARYSERTIVGPTGQIEHVPVESTAEAIMEIRRRSGLTWEELGDLFDVSRRSIHHWANGKPVSARHDQMIRRMLAALRRLDQGDGAGTRALLLTVDPATGISTLELLKDGRFDEAMGRVAGERAPEPNRVPLSRAAQDARRPQAPALLLDDEVAGAETSFDELRDIAQEVDTERHDKLLVTTRRSIREKNYDAARRSLDEMQGIRMKVLAESPDFLIEIFRRLAEERHLAVDEAIHDQHVEAGVEVAKSGNVDQLRFVIGQMFGNRVSTGADAAEIVELAHLLVSDPKLIE